MMRCRVAGVALAGGDARRFGSDKATAMYRGQTLLDRSLSALQPYSEFLLVAGRPHGRHAESHDRPSPGLGPLGGLCGALFVARERGMTHLLSAPCDTPAIPEGLLQLLVRQAAGAFAADCPVIGFWPTCFADHLQDYLKTDRPRSMQAWAAAAGVAPLPWSEPILNINRRADLDAAHR